LSKVNEAEWRMTPRLMKIIKRKHKETGTHAHNTTLLLLIVLNETTATSTGENTSRKGIDQLQQHKLDR
jgi:hypothetical protein